jgi:aminoglycoside phosphotransferase (APT) family kinase protein
MTGSSHPPGQRGATAGDELAAALATALGELYGEADCEVAGLHRLAGGSSRETWSFELLIPGGRRERLVLRRDPPGAPSSGMGRERRVIHAALLGDVPVPRVVTASDDPTVLGSSFVVMEHVEGETIPRRVLNEPTLAVAREHLASQCGTILAAIHRLPLDEVGDLAEGNELFGYRELLDQLGDPHPAFELAFRWLDANPPAPGGRGVVHGDFRNGNLIVGPEGVRAVLDWELAHVGDPIEDLGWLCVKAWRFASPSPVGGFGDYEELIAAYEAAGGGRVDMGQLKWWELFGTLRWGIICMVQATTHLSGAVRSVELAAIGRRVCEVESDVLDLLEEVA